jgi:outer membrane lipase/esterase
VTTFNATLEAGLAGKNLLYFNTGKMLNTVIANPAAYGFSNIKDAALTSAIGNVPSPLTADYLFADIRHPSAKFHRIMSDWIYTSLEGSEPYRPDFASAVGALWRPMARD